MHLSDTDTQRLKDLVAAFLVENAKVNLSALRTQEQCFIGNVLDSVAFIDLLPSLAGTDWQSKPLRILDIGTGGGFPLLPLAMLLPHCEFVGLDAVLKKVDAVDRIIKTMQIPNAKVVSARAEEYAHRDSIRGSFDIVTFRAVAPIATLLEYGIPFLKMRGKCVLWKSMHIADELRLSLNATKELHTSLIQTSPYTLPGDWGERQLLVYEKNAGTASSYPRKNGLPKNKPL
ncbi:MAG: 16S rRNA (guanine(527)-N(7))-methyltransferase RsmG [Candidatus Peribacteraceae bacterium]|nr:16S rRNA (guanine(527)-N(7))-methyltransferase RsmG [Candidatus Peribacteraceae bacterium]